MKVEKIGVLQLNDQDVAVWRHYNPDVKQLEQYGVLEQDVARATGSCADTLRRYRANLTWDLDFFNVNENIYWTTVGLTQAAKNMQRRNIKKAELIRELMKKSAGIAFNHNNPNVVKKENGIFDRDMTKSEYLAAAATGAPPETVKELLETKPESIHIEKDVPLMVSNKNALTIKMPYNAFPVTYLIEAIFGKYDQEAHQAFDRFVNDNLSILPDPQAIFTKAKGPDGKDTVLIQTLAGLAFIGATLDRAATEDNMEPLVSLAGVLCVGISKIFESYSESISFYRYQKSEPLNQDKKADIVVDKLEVLKMEVKNSVVEYLSLRERICKRLSHVISDAISDTVREAQKMLRLKIDSAAEWATPERVNHAIKHFVGAGPRSGWPEVAEFKAGLEFLQTVRNTLGIHGDNPISVMVADALLTSTQEEQDMLKLLQL